MYIYTHTQESDQQIEGKMILSISQQKTKNSSN